MTSDETLVNEVLPCFDVTAEYSTKVNATPASVYAIVQQGMPVGAITRLLMALRNIPRLFRKESGTRMPYNAFYKLKQLENREIVIGIVGQFWKPVSNPLPIHNLEEFLEFKKEGYCTMIRCNRSSTSSRDQLKRMEFWLISRPEVATPPALAALPGPYRMPAFRYRSTASGADGMFAPSETSLQPFLSSVLASSPVISFWVALGKAQSARHRPGSLAGNELRAELLRIVLDAPATDVLEVQHPGQLLRVNPGGVMDGPVRVGERDRLGAALQELLDGVLRDVAGAGNGNKLSINLVAGMMMPL